MTIKISGFFLCSKCKGKTQGWIIPSFSNNNLNYHEPIIEFDKKTFKREKRKRYLNINKAKESRNFLLKNNRLKQQ